MSENPRSQLSAAARTDSPVDDAAFQRELTELVRDLLPASKAAGDATKTDSLNTLLPQVYDELRALAASYLRNERPDHTLQPTALVHEVYLRLAGDRPVDWQNRAHFLGIAARIMRRILINHAVARSAQKRGGGEPRLALDEALHFSEQHTLSLTGVDEALRSLEALDPRQGQIVELRFFGGLTTEEIATVLDISVSTVKREWATAKLWLQRQLDNDPIA